jgi:hypothetical protein
VDKLADALATNGRAMRSFSGLGVVSGLVLTGSGLAGDATGIATLGVTLITASLFHRLTGNQASLVRNRSQLERSFAETATAIETKLDATSERLDAYDRRTHETVTAIETKLDATSERLGRERSARIVGVVNSLTAGWRPESIVLIHSIHRTASTLTLDVCRSVDGCGIWPSAQIWTHLGLKGRRYPIDLSGGATGVHELEVATGLGDLIPDVGNPRYSIPSVAFEKLHPSFYDHDVETFLQRIESAKARFDCPVTVMAVVRTPLDAMWSMAEYKVRNPRWHADTEPRNIPITIADDFAAIVKVVKQIGGHVITFEEVTNAGSGLIAPLASLSGQSQAAVRKQVAPRFDGRDLENAQNRGFVGERSASRSIEGPESIWVDHIDVIASAQADYEYLINQR